MHQPFLTGTESVLLLLRALRRPTSSKPTHNVQPMGLSFASAGAPGDRRGRIARKLVDRDDIKSDVAFEDGMTPRNNTNMSEAAREKEFLAGLR
jgi:hypothetical protein